MSLEYGYLGGEKAVGTMRGRNILMEMWIAPLLMLGGNYNLLILIIFIFKKIQSTWIEHLEKLTKCSCNMNLLTIFEKCHTTLNTLQYNDATFKRPLFFHLCLWEAFIEY